MMISADRMRQTALRNSAQQSRIRRERMDRLRGVAHTKTRREWREELGVGASTLDTYLAELGERAKPEKRSPESRRASAATLRQRLEKLERLDWLRDNAHKYTRNEIAQRFGCAGFTVNRYLDELGIDARLAGSPVEAFEMMREWLRKPIVGRTHRAALREIAKDREEGWL